METRSWFALPAAQEWFYARQHPDYRPLPPLREDCRAASEAASPLALLTPAPGAAVYVPIELDGKRGRVVFEASHRDAAAELYWHLDDAFVGTTVAPHQMALAPAPGAHRLTVVDADGNRVERAFTVLEGATSRR
jgi:penicillin-binding protein 1C